MEKHKSNIYIEKLQSFLRKVEKYNKIWYIKISDINSGWESWVHVWKTQSTLSIRYKSIISLKSIFKGFWVDFADSVCDCIFETSKNIFTEFKDQI